MTTNHVAAPSQFLYLATIKEPGLAYLAGRDQEVRFPPKLIEHIRDVEHRAHAPIVKGE